MTPIYLENLTLSQLRALARGSKIPNYWHLHKTELSTRLTASILWKQETNAS